MNFVKLVEDGTYKYDELNEKNKAFIDGINHVMDNVLDCVFDDSEYECMSETLGAIQKEMAEGIINRLKEELYITTCELIVALSDEEEAERNANKEINTKD